MKNQKSQFLKEFKSEHPNRYKNDEKKEHYILWLEQKLLEKNTQLEKERKLEIKEYTIKKMKTFDIPIFPAKFTIFLNKDFDYLEEKYDCEIKSSWEAVTCKVRKFHNHYIVGFKSNNRSLVAHEIVHLVNFIYRDLGIELDRYNDENQAYLTAWFFEKIDNFMNEYK